MNYEDLLTNNFEDDRYSLIGDFEDDCIEAGFIQESFTDKQIDIIKEKFEDHRECYKHKSEFDNENLEIMSSVVYGDYENVAIECFQCNSIIIDIDSLIAEKE